MRTLRSSSAFRVAALLGVGAFAPGIGSAQVGFVNWESPHVHPLELTPDGARLLAVNTADARLAVFALSDGAPTLAAEISVGLDPVSVRAESNARAWVVNHISDSVSIVDLLAHNVVATLRTDDEPADVVFAGAPLRAYVSCSQANTVLVFDPARLDLAPRRIPIDGEDPRALAVSNDGAQVWVAIFESGNASTVLGGGALFNFDFPPNVVSSRVSPYSGRNPPPNSAREGGFEPPQRAGNPPPPRVGLIVKRDDEGRWRDDFAGDWTHLVSGPNAAQSGRVPGWDVADHDLARIDTASSRVSYVRRLMNACMALAVHPKSGSVFVVGTDATNERRFEPVLRGRFLRVEAARVAADGAPQAVIDLNPHLDPATSTASDEARKRSLGDPRGIAWNSDGSRGFVTGMGSNNVVPIDSSGARVSELAPIRVGEGPTGIVFESARERLFVLNRFEGSISMLDARALVELKRVRFFDPTPAAIRNGRKHLFDTHANSGQGQLACASCHIDARMDHLAWDLGDPSGEVAPFDGANLAADNSILIESVVPERAKFQPFHPMKGPMTTQTLQGIIGLEPLHWRGDRSGLEAFNGAFQSLQARAAQLTAGEMQELEDYLATIRFPPNPFRNLDNSLPADLALPGHFTTGHFGEAGAPLPNGNARRGLERFRTGKLDNRAVDCVTCHTLPTGAGTDFKLVEGKYQPIPAGAQGERHHMLVAQDGSTNVSMKVPQLRNLYEKVGCDLSRPSSRLGFGFQHDGSIDSLARFVNESSFSLESDQDTADLLAFLLAFSGSGLPAGAADNVREPPGTSSADTHAAVGWQVTLSATPSTALAKELGALLRMADSGAVGVVVKGRVDGAQRGWCYAGEQGFQSDREQERIGVAELFGKATAGGELTLTVVPRGTERRIGVDRDGDGALDRDELDQGADPKDSRTLPLRRER